MFVLLQRTCRLTPVSCCVSLFWTHQSLWTSSRSQGPSFNSGRKMLCNNLSDLTANNNKVFLSAISGKEETCAVLAIKNSTAELKITGSVVTSG